MFVERSYGYDHRTGISVFKFYGAFPSFPREINTSGRGRRICNLNVSRCHSLSAKRHFPELPVLQTTLCFPGFDFIINFAGPNLMIFSRTMNHNHSVADGRAFAFLLLDDCELEMQGIEKPMTLGQWMDVQLVVDEGYAHQKSKACERCLLVLQMNDNQIFLSWDRIQVADGYLGKSNHTCPYCGKNRRSDASLLMGLVKFCSNMVAVESCRVFFRSHNRGSLVLNIDFPLLDTSAPVGRRSILGENPDKTKRLHVATQTILAMLRSDWNFLCFFMEELKRLFARNMIPEILLSRAGQTIFPSDLSAETLYSHVNGSPLLSQVIDNWLRYDCDRGSDQCIFTTLSTEILCDSLAPFLQSNSLNSLRSTCSYLYHTLHAIAPGLKLRLFSHQKEVSGMDESPRGDGTKGVYFAAADVSEFIFH